MMTLDYRDRYHFNLYDELCLLNPSTHNKDNIPKNRLSASYRNQRDEEIKNIILPGFSTSEGATEPTLLWKQSRMFWTSLK